MQLPVMPPVKPMLAKAVKRCPIRRRAGGCSTSPSGTASAASSSATATRSSSASRNERAAHPLLPRGGRSGPQRSFPSGAWSTARSSSPPARRSTSRRCSSGIHPAEVAGRQAGRRDAGVVRRLRPARPRRRGPDRRGRSASAARGSSRRCAEREAADPPDARDRRPAVAARLVRARSRAPGSTASSPSPPTCAYRQNERVMLKIKHLRTADCVVAGFRWHKSGPVRRLAAARPVRRRRPLQHVGVCGVFTAGAGAELVDELAPLPDGGPRRTIRGRDGPSGGGATPRSGCPARSRRWNADKDLSWVPLRPELVCEVATTTWRAPASATRPSSAAGGRTATRSCTYDQLEEVVRFDLATVLAGG